MFATLQDASPGCCFLVVHLDQTTCAPDGPNLQRALSFVLKPDSSVAKTTAKTNLRSVFTAIKCRRGSRKSGSTLRRGIL